MKLIDVLKLIDDSTIISLYSRIYDLETKEDMDILAAFGLKIEIKINEKYLNAPVIYWNATYFTNENNVCYILIEG